MMGEEFTRLEVRLEGCTQTIAVPMDRDLFVDTENVVPSLGPLCSDVESKTLEKMDNATLSRSIAGLALRLSFSTSFVLCLLSSTILGIVLTLHFLFLSSSDYDSGN